jgi:hypothetical protein
MTSEALVKWRKIAADHNQWRSMCRSKGFKFDAYCLARSGVIVIETGWNLRLERRIQIFKPLDVRGLSDEIEEELVRFLG